MYSPAFYAACTAGGIASCGLTHMAVTPLDLVKCNMQVSGSGLDLWPWCSTSSFFLKNLVRIYGILVPLVFFLVMFLFLQNKNSRLGTKYV